MKKATLRKALYALCFPFLLAGCEDKMDEHYEIPGWVAGSEWEVLSSGEHGNFSIFLEGCDIAGYTNMLKGRSVMTVMAPDDEAFRAYLEEKGYASIKDMPVEEVKKLIGFHLVNYSYTKDMLENFRPEGSGVADDGTPQLDAGLYYKHRTRSQDEPTLEYNPSTARTCWCITANVSCRSSPASSSPHARLTRSQTTSISTPTPRGRATRASMCRTRR